MTFHAARWHAQFTAAYPKLLRFLRRRNGDVDRSSTCCTLVRG